jgi:hypothetical protein
MPFKSTSNIVVYHRGIPTHDPSFSFWVSLNYNILKKMQRADPNYLHATASALCDPSRTLPSVTPPALSPVIAMQFH